MINRRHWWRVCLTAGVRGDLKQNVYGNRQWISSRIIITIKFVSRRLNANIELSFEWTHRDFVRLPSVGQYGPDRSPRTAKGNLKFSIEIQTAPAASNRLGSTFGYDVFNPHSPGPGPVSLLPMCLPLNDAIGVWNAMKPIVFERPNEPTTGVGPSDEVARHLHIPNMHRSKPRLTILKQ